jgi:hypothetical protein
VVVSKTKIMGWYDTLAESLEEKRQYDFKSRAKFAIQDMIAAAKEVE